MDMRLCVCLRVCITVTLSDECAVGTSTCCSPEYYLQVVRRLQTRVEARFAAGERGARGAPWLPRVHRAGEAVEVERHGA